MCFERRKTVQKQIEKLQELFDTTINSLPDEEVTMNLALFHPTGTSLDVRIFLSDLLQVTLNICTICQSFSIAPSLISFGKKMPILNSST